MSVKSKDKAKSNGHGGTGNPFASNMLCNNSVPLELRQMLLRDLAMSTAEEHTQQLAQLLERAAEGSPDVQLEELRAELAQKLEALENGPLRPATYLGQVPGTSRGAVRVQVKLKNGEDAFPVARDEEILKELECGDLVLVDAQTRCVLSRWSEPIETGEVVRFERCLDSQTVLATVRDQEPQTFRVTAALGRRLAAGEVAVGTSMLACTRRQIALGLVEEEPGAGHYRFLSRDPLPDVVIGRDLGDPHPFIDEVLTHLRRELECPELSKMYRLHRAVTKLLAGVTGAGKTVSILALIRAAYELFSGRLGVPLESLPVRVMRLRAASVGSKYVFETDKKIDKFFDEVIRLADEKICAPDGKEYELPVFVVFEECDSFGRERGTDHEQVFDRIQATLLERLDANSQRFASRLIVVLCTTNVPHLLDPAFLRRVGGTVEYFGRLNRKGFIKVLQKRLERVPIDESFGADSKQRELGLTRAATHWFFGPDATDPGQVEVTYVGSSQPVVFRRRAFLTPGLIDRAVQQASLTACNLHAEGDSRGVTKELLLEAFGRQVRAIVDQLTVHNVANHLTLPDGVRVAQVRRIEQPKLATYELERATA